MDVSLTCEPWSHEALWKTPLIYFIYLVNLGGMAVFALLAADVDSLLMFIVFSWVLISSDGKISCGGTGPMTCQDDYPAVKVPTYKERRPELICFVMFLMFLDVSGCFLMFLDVSGCFLMFLDVSGCFLMFLDVS